MMHVRGIFKAEGLESRIYGYASSYWRQHFGRFIVQRGCSYVSVATFCDSRDSRTTSSMPLECLINLCPPATSSVHRSSPLFPKSKARRRWEMVSSVFFFSNCKLDTASHLDVTKRIRQPSSWLSTPVRPSILICLLPSVVGSARSQPECKISPRLRSFC